MRVPDWKSQRGAGLLYALGILLIGALIGTVVGEVIVSTSPEGGIVHRVFVNAVTFGLDPTTLDLRVFKLHVGFNIRLNFASVLGFGFAAFLLKRIN